ncbi:DUF3800 domain-containing protein [Aurantimonas marina]|uniref:DUF3800 domain-containing protein n=1 Tax=Aurantimonas marina TaxID=2780508 RepID=UPI0019D19F11|nr:DUF3800 domain-containing protein [Aurantimonas marina]
MPKTPNYSDFVFYADESGDHSLRSIDPAYPVFCLALCGFRKRTYSSSIVPRFQDFKFRYFGHDAVVLHEREIRQQSNDFRILTDRNLRARFNEELSSLVARARFRVFSCVIDKRLITSDMFPDHPYHVSLKLGLQGAYRFLRSRGQESNVTHFIFEKRGAKEDAELELEFFRIIQGQNDLRVRMDGFRIILADKKTNSTGMQLADLVARPIGLRFVRPSQPNRAYETIEAKLSGYSKDASAKRGIFIPKSERPRNIPEPNADRETPIHL